MPNWLGLPELVLILLIVLLLFGANRLPEIAKALGRSIRDFKKASKDISDEIIKEEPSDKDQKKGQSPAAPRLDDKK